MQEAEYYIFEFGPMKSKKKKNAFKNSPPPSF